MKLSKLLPQSFSTRLILITFISGFIPIIIFAILINIFGDRFVSQTSQAIKHGQDEQWQRSRAVLEQMAKDTIRQKALDVALQVELYLKAHPELTVEKLKKDIEFRKIAIQNVGKTGYTAIQDAENAINCLHKNPSFENINIRTLADKLPKFWSIIEASLYGRYSDGHYQWKENDGTIRDKYMFIVPLNLRTADGVLFSVSATTYVDEFTRSIKAAQDVTQGTTHLLLITINSLIEDLRAMGFFYMGVSIGLVLFLASLAGIYFSRTIKHLRLATKAVHKGNYDVQLQPLMSGDVGQLIADFNLMVDNLTATTVKKEQLENLVEGRTRELSLANIQLKEEIEERKLAVEALQLNEKRINAILQASPVGIGLVADNQLKWVNETMSLLLGYSSEWLLNKDISMLYPDHRELKRVDRALSWKIYHAEIVEVTTQWMKKDLTVFDCTIRGYPLDPQDPAQGVIITVTDISESLQLEKRLRQAQKMEAIGTLAGGVAHDLNNILSGIVTYPELLLLDMPENSPLVKPLLTIKKSGEKATAVVQDLLTMARRGVAVPEIVSINTIITSILACPEFVQLKEYHPDIHIITRLKNNLLNIHGSEPHLAKTVMNLAINGAEAMPQGGALTITTENITFTAPFTGFETIEEGDYVTLSIQDTGVGLTADEIIRVFEPFYTTKKLGRSGSGLGMAVVWGTVKDHHGYIDIKSIKGGGSTFTLYFPATHEEFKEPEEFFTIETYLGKGETILVVDDFESQREIARQSLTKLHYNVTSVSTGEEAVKYLKANSVDLIVLDMIMDPGMDGLDTYQQISEFKPDQKVIIASGFSESERVKKVQAMSGCQYIKKPYTLQRLGKAVRKELQRNAELL